MTRTALLRTAVASAGAMVVVGACVGVAHAADGGFLGLLPLSDVTTQEELEPSDSEQDGDASPPAPESSTGESSTVSPTTSDEETPPAEESPSATESPSSETSTSEPYTPTNIPKGLVGKTGDQQRGPRGRGAEMRDAHAQDSAKRPTHTKRAPASTKQVQTRTKRVSPRTKQERAKVSQSKGETKGKKGKK